jgi:hypothetical protein
MKKITALSSLLCILINVFYLHVPVVHAKRTNVFVETTLKAQLGIVEKNGGGTGGCTFTGDSGIMVAKDVSIYNMINIQDETISIRVVYSAGFAWIAFGFSSTGTMVPSTPIIGLPEENTVCQYNVTGYSANSIQRINHTATSGTTPLSNQLIYQVIDDTTEIGSIATVLEFTLPLSFAFPDANATNLTSITPISSQFIWAIGTCNKFSSIHSMKGTNNFESFDFCTANSDVTDTQNLPMTNQPSTKPVPILVPPSATTSSAPTVRPFKVVTTTVPTVLPTNTKSNPTIQPTKMTSNPSVFRSKVTSNPSRTPFKSTSSFPTRSPTIRSMSNIPLKISSFPTRLPPKLTTTLPTLSPIIKSTSLPTHSPSKSPSIPTRLPLKSTSLPTLSPTKLTLIPTRLPIKVTSFPTQRLPTNIPATTNITTTTQQNDCSYPSLPQRILVGEDTVDVTNIVNQDEQTIRIKMTYNQKGYIAFGFNKSPYMVPATVIIGLPGSSSTGTANTIGMYTITGTSVSEILPIPIEEQSLTLFPDTVVLVQNHDTTSSLTTTTTMEFTLSLTEQYSNDFGSIITDPSNPLSKQNRFIWSAGNDNILQYHKHHGSDILQLNYC